MASYMFCLVEMEFKYLLLALWSVVRYHISLSLQLYLFWWW